MSTGTFIPLNTTNRYKDKQGRYLTRGLFKETCFNENVEASYTLSDEDRDGLPSAKKIYLECRDPSERRAAIALLGSWAHWKRLCECDWFQEYLEDWREELEVLLRSEALEVIVNKARSNSKDALAAARFLVDKGWAPKETQRGRPTKHEVEKQAKIHARIVDQVENHLKLVQ